MRYLSQLSLLLIKHEGLRLKPYKDSVGKLTIGVGRNLDDNGITKDEALSLLHNDIENAVKEAQENFIWYNGLDNTRKSVVINMLFNLGMPRFLTFKKMIRAIESKKYSLASVEMLDSVWAKQVKSRALELAAMMETGDVG